ncbi:hypothetical protein C8024_15545 [Sphingopyxis sp. BSNA05]|nr:hypothetical protein [Sphingopyxis sp. BSNA05]
MLLLFNAVGLAVPASAAAAERVVPELGSAASLSEAAEAESSAIIAAAVYTLPDHQSCAWAEACLVASRTIGKPAVTCRTGPLSRCAAKPATSWSMKKARPSAIFCFADIERRKTLPKFILFAAGYRPSKFTNWKMSCSAV